MEISRTWGLDRRLRTAPKSRPARPRNQRGQCFDEAGSCRVSDVALMWILMISRPLLLAADRPKISSKQPAAAKAPAAAPASLAVAMTNTGRSSLHQVTNVPNTRLVVPPSDIFDEPVPESPFHLIRATTPPATASAVWAPCGCSLPTNRPDPHDLADIGPQSGMLRCAYRLVRQRLAATRHAGAGCPLGGGRPVARLAGKRMAALDQPRL